MVVDRWEKDELEWAVSFVLENGESAVWPWGYMIHGHTRQDCERRVQTFNPGVFGFSDEGDFWIAADAPVSVIRAVGCQGIPRTDYSPAKHDSFHLRLGPRVPRFLIDNAKPTMEYAGLCADIKNPDGALDVMASLSRRISKVPDIGEGSDQELVKHLQELLQEAHPVIWSEPMVKMADHAALQLKESVTAGQDLVPLNPSIWLYCEPQWVTQVAKDCAYPFTPDGHLPWPDEITRDAGTFGVATLFGVYHSMIQIFLFDLKANEEEHAWYLYPSMAEIRLGDTPEHEFGQYLLKLMLFATSPYLIVQRYEPRRVYARRAAGRFPVASGGIGVIILRRAQYLQSRESTETEGVNWNCQWWVSGHWRRQWHPSTKLHKMTWIAPYIKGPADKPLKECVRLMVR